MTVSIDGSICLWDTQGLCVASELNVLSIPCPALAVLLSDNRHIACAGHSSDVEIVDLWSLDVVATLSGKHQDWICSLFPLPQNEDSTSLLLTASVDGEIVFWMITFAQDNADPKSKNLSGRPPECIPLTSVMIEGGTILNAAVSPNLKTVLVVCAEKWILLTAANPRMLFEVPAPEGRQWCGGAFMHYNRVILWDKSEAFIYVLPSQADLHTISFVPISPSKFNSNASASNDSLFLPKVSKSFFNRKETNDIE